MTKIKGLTSEQFKQRIDSKKCCNDTAKYGNPEANNYFEDRIPTGFRALDAKLNGGLTSGICCIGALSGLGKTTFAMQMAENMSVAGTPAIYFSLEMSARTLARKSVSRQTYLYARTQNKPNLARVSADLANKAKWDALDQDKRETIARAAEIATRRTKEIVIEDCTDGEWTVGEIGNYVDQWMDLYQQKPVVFIDYLQILPSNNIYAQERKIIKDNVSALSKIATRHQIPIVFLSSISREYYNKPMSMQALKESGDIEYSCDTIIGMQYAGTGGKEFDARAAKSKPVRDVELLILKHREADGACGIRFAYCAAYNYFWDSAASLDDATDTPEPDSCQEEDPGYRGYDA